MSRRDPAVDESILNRRGELEEAQNIGYGRSLLSKLIGEFVLGQAIALDERPIGLSEFDRIQVLALDVLDESELEQLIDDGLSDYDRYCWKLQSESRSEPSFARNQLVPAGGQAVHDEGLQNATSTYRLCQVVKCSVIEHPTRLVPVHGDRSWVQVQDAIARLELGCRRFRLPDHLRDQGVEPLSEFSCAHGRESPW